MAAQIVPVLVMIPELFPKARARHGHCADVRGERIVLRRVFAVHCELAGGAHGQHAGAAWYVAAACLVSLVPVIWLRDRTGEAL
ncbi:hypothetical protein [Arthrobacter methylotrophus]|uniref:hypothetical protein n=1 Tax=Arthrobacter methylotrophus TaxID=121291 RepID=UPI0031F07F5C